MFPKKPIPRSQPHPGWPIRGLGGRKLTPFLAPLVTNATGTSGRSLDLREIQVVRSCGEAAWSYETHDPTTPWGWRECMSGRGRQPIVASCRKSISTDFARRIAQPTTTSRVSIRKDGRRSLPSTELQGPATFYLLADFRQTSDQQETSL